MLHLYALYVQLDDVLPFVLHKGRGLSDKWFRRYSCSGFDYQILLFAMYSSYMEHKSLFCLSFIHLNDEKQLM